MERRRPHRTRRHPRARADRPDRRRTPRGRRRHAPRRPGAAARHLDYAELDRRSRRAARRLRELGVRDGAVVALCLDKTPELVVTLLAVLRAGGAYLPLDPGYPVDRLAYMTANADAVLLLTDRDRPELAGLAPQSLTVGQLETGPDSADPDGPAVALDAPAYVIYTSGSTGRPKAVRVSHRNLASVYAGWRAAYRLDQDVRVHLQMAAQSFDVFTGDLVRALCSGGTLVLVDRDLLFDTARLHRTMVEERVDCAEFVPAVARALLAHCERDGHRLDFMRLLIVGSDAWKAEEHQRLHALCGPDTRLVNSYGLTEATIDSAWFEGPADGAEPGRMVPIGRPFPNSALYVLDEHGEPVPPGVAGELWVGGAGVADGYVGDPEQTAQRFTTRALGGRTVRLYRTGDLAHWDADGTVRLLGRADNQVKVRGHRIELGEIETQLAALPGVGQCAVTVRQVDDGGGVLCAYYVPEPGADPLPRELRRSLADRLPAFMTPSHLTALPALPLTPNGKVDTAALPEPRFDPGDGEPEPPTTLFEVRMAEHWKSLLGLELVGLQHDFFEAGGSSIKLIELIHHLQAEFNLSIPVSLLFESTTLRGMARTLEHIITGRIAGARPYLCFNPGDGGDGTVFCFPPAGGHGLVYRQLAAHLPEYQFLAFNFLTGADKVARYADLIESFREQGPYTLLGYSLGGNLAFEVAKELERRGHEVPHVLIVDSYRITDAFELRPEHLDAFEKELREHLHRHTGSDAVAEETLSQAREYLDFCSRTPNLGSVRGLISVISDEQKVPFYAAGNQGTWHGSSSARTTVFRGFGSHAEMLDQDFAARNAELTRGILTGTRTEGAAGAAG
nr:amino acid adenylation domain-containing protein [Kitasatospora cheerisanensis]